MTWPEAAVVITLIIVVGIAVSLFTYLILHDS